MEYTGNRIYYTMSNLAANADGMQKNLWKINNLAKKIKVHSIETTNMIKSGKLDDTMKELVQLLDGAATDSNLIREDLDRISKDLNKLKSEIESMIIDARYRYDQVMTQHPTHMIFFFKKNSAV